MALARVSGPGNCEYYCSANMGKWQYISDKIISTKLNCVLKKHTRVIEGVKNEEKTKIAA